MVREGESTKKISKQRAMVKAVVNKSIKGDVAAVRTVLGTNKMFEQQDAPNEDAPLDADDIEVLEAFERRLLARAKADEGANHDHGHDQDERS